MRILTKKTKGVRYPSVIGHEICGVIAQVGSDVKGFEVGEKVAVANVIPCHHCSSCLRGRENACLDRKANGYEFDGGFEDFIRIPAICIENGNIVKLSDQVSYAAGALIEQLACCIRGLKNAGTGECTVEVNTIHYGEINVNGSTAYKMEDYLEAAEMVKSGKINADIVVTHKFKIDRLQEIYEVCVSGASLKVVIAP